MMIIITIIIIIIITIIKGEGAVQPLGVGEVTRRIIGKWVMRVTQPNAVKASGSLQVCAGHKSGSEAVIHAMHNIFDANGTDAVLLVDASNALNSSAADFWSVQLIRLGQSHQTLCNMLDDLDCGIIDH